MVFSNPYFDAGTLLFEGGRGSIPVLWQELSEKLFEEIPQACEQIYHKRLLSIAVFGSIARGVWNKNSDIDLLIVASDFPKGRFHQMEEFSKVEKLLEPLLGECRKAGWEAELSPVFKTPAHVEEGSPIFFDMTVHTILLLDQGNLLRNRLNLMRERMQAMGSKRIFRGPNAWTWILKPDFKKGESIVL